MSREEGLALVFHFQCHAGLSGNGHPFSVAFLFFKAEFLEVTYKCVSYSLLSRSLLLVVALDTMRRAFASDISLH
jgi:hypothetical protein